MEICEFPRLLEKNEESALGLLSEYRGLADPLVEEHGGTLVDVTGEELLITFGSVVEAVQCALHLMLAVSARNAHAQKTPLRIRAGVHLGEIWSDGSRVYGNGVNIAARIKSEAGPLELLVSEDVYRQIVNKLDVPTRRLPDRRLKNIEQELVLYALGEKTGNEPAQAGLPEEAEPRSSPRAGPAVPPRANSDLAARSAELGARIGELAGEALRKGIESGKITAERVEGEANIRIHLKRRDPADAHPKGAARIDAPLSKRPKEGAAKANLDTDQKELSRDLLENRLQKATSSFITALCVTGAFGWAYWRYDKLWLAIAGLLIGVLPAVSNLKKLIATALDLKDRK